MRHPQHDEVVEAIRAQYRTSYPDLGYLVEERPLGWYGSNAGLPAVGRVTLRDITPDLIPSLLDDVTSYYSSVPITLFVDDRASDPGLRPALEAAGLEAGPSICYLAYTGPAQQPLTVARLMLEPVLQPQLREYAVTKIKSFANSEDEPPAQQLADEIAQRTPELTGGARFLIARIDGEAAAIVGWYTGGVAHIFQLATRLAFRRRGIATALLCHIVEVEQREGARSIIINADEDDRPIDLYRRLGFTDEVYWRRPYRVPIG